MTESRTRSKPAAKETASKPAATKASSSKASSAKVAEVNKVKKVTKSVAESKSAVVKKPAAAKKTESKASVATPVKVKATAVKKPAVIVKAPAAQKPAVTAKKAVAAKVAPAVTKPLNNKKASADSVATKPAVGRPATTKGVAPVKKPAATKAAASKPTAVSKKPSATMTAAMPNKSGAANSPVIPKKQASVKADVAGNKKSVTPKRIAETAATPQAEPKKRKAAAPKKAMPAQVAAELMAEASPEVVAEVPADKPSIQGASISFSAVQEPPQHLTLRVDVNRVVAFHYRLREIRPDGSFSPWIEESFGRQPLFYLHGHGNVIAGLEQALAGRKAGDAINITLPPELAYGQRTSNDVMRLPIKHLHGNVNPKALLPGSIVTMKTNQGLKNALVMKVGKFNVDVDTNHPYAGRTLHYQIEILGVRPASAEEVAHRHVHGPGGHQH